jgi:hypothetical protein
MQNVFLDDRGFPDQSDKYNHLLHSIDGVTVLRKLQHPMLDLNGPVDPSFDHPFILEEHKDILRKKVDLSHLDPDQQLKVYDLIREFWPVFDERGVFVPVKNYDCVINTGAAHPTAIKKIFYGKQETVIMQQCILALAKVGHIWQITDGRWLCWYIAVDTLSTLGSHFYSYPSCHHDDSRSPTGYEHPNALRKKTASPLAWQQSKIKILFTIGRGGLAIYYRSSAA